MAPLPRLLGDVRGQVCLVVDVVRFSTFLVALFDRGGRQAYLCESPAGALALRRSLGDGALAFGETIGSGPASGCDAAPSLEALDDLDLRGRTAAVSSENGAGAVLACYRRGASQVLVAALCNLDAAAERALQLAGGRHRVAQASSLCVPGRGQRQDPGVTAGPGITIVCAGVAGNSRVALDDVYVAGRLLQALKAAPERCDDGARMALATVAAYPGASAALEASITARWLRAAGCGRDVELCSLENTSEIVPVAAPAEGYTGAVCRVIVD